MDTQFLEQMRISLQEKRNSLAEWLFSTPSAKKGIRLGTAEEDAVQKHLVSLDDALKKVSNGSYGECEICHNSIEPELLEKDYICCVCLDEFTQEEKRTLELELELAQSVQKSLLPQQVPDIPGLEISAFSRPVQIITGDYYDFLDFKNGAFGLAIADVEGHGIGASLHMASLQALLRTLTPISETPLDVVRQLHRLLIHNVRFPTFITLFLGAFNPQTRELNYCNAGHNPPIILRKDINQRELLSWLRPTGAAIGLVEESQFNSAAIQFFPGDVVIFYTDGITEAMNIHKEEFAAERLAQVVKRALDSSAKDMVSMIRQELDTFTEGQLLADDITILVCKLDLENAGN